MKMMRPHRRRRLAEPVHHFGSVREIDIAGAGGSSNGVQGILQGRHRGHDVNDGFSRKTRNRSASNVLGHPDKPWGQSVTEDMHFMLERLDPPRVVLCDLDRRVIHNAAPCGLTLAVSRTQRLGAARHTITSAPRGAKLLRVGLDQPVMPNAHRCSRLNVPGGKHLHYFGPSRAPVIVCG